MAKGVTTPIQANAVSSSVATVINLEARLTISIAVSVQITVRERNKDVHVLPLATKRQWRRVAKLARITIDDDELVELSQELNSIVSYVNKLSSLDVEGIEPMTSVVPFYKRMREDKVTEGDIADDILKNAPVKDDHFFVVPKVVE